MRALLGTFMVLMLIGWCCAPSISPGPHSVRWYADRRVMRSMMVASCRGSQGRTTDLDCINADLASSYVRRQVEHR